jgi:hypothetical protein
MLLRPATRDDLIALQGKLPEHTMRAHVAEVDGKVLAVGGVYYVNGTTVAFSYLADEIRGHRKSIMRAAKFAMEKIAALPGPVYALCSRDEATAPQFLARLGFEFFAPSNNGDIYKLRSG